MRLHSGVDNTQLMVMLQDALVKETQIWKPLQYEPVKNKDVEIGSEERDEATRWLGRLTEQFHMHPETMALAVTVLDRFLHSVKARPKYLRCITLTCFYLAAKSTEEDEIIPGTDELVRESGCACSVVDVLRMERIILDKLSWDLRSITSLDFLHIFHALLMSRCPHLLDSMRNMTASRQLSILTRKLERCIAFHEILAYRPATVALALLSLELELFVPEWFRMTIALQKTIQVNNHDLIHCREIMTHHLSLYPRLHVAYIHNKTSKRKVEEIEVDDDEDIYDSIKRLYNEDDNSSSVITVVSGS
ncbi:unnamed protein product [Owenia fusiformis]|uniref:Uncharacterized protein n=1 Tax=Owenia fusiformis TaxID=6347 RepID=A0A8J1TG21_OWEFU|nr:unnamed protein product [Owenia fusiformis]